MSSAPNVILFDGVCKLCNGWSQFILRYDTSHSFKLCSVQSPAGQQLLAENGYPLDYYETMLVIYQGKLYEKSDAFLCVMRQLPAPWCWLRVLAIIPKLFRDWSYDRIALNRYKIFGRYDRCLLPSAEQVHRFL